MSHLPMHWSAMSEKKRPRVRHTRPRARGPRAGVAPPRLSFFTHALGRVWHTYFPHPRGKLSFLPKRNKS